VSLAGSQVDLLVTQRDAAGGAIRSAVECKAYGKLVGLKTVKSFFALVQLLRERALVDRAVLVSINGFTVTALNFGVAHQIELIRLSELHNASRGREQEVIKRVEAGFEDEAKSFLKRPIRQRVLVVMPFAKKFDDIYIIGIREVAERLGLVVERADDIEHNNQILEVIQQKIRDYDLIVADISSQNPNVFYEVGYAHAAETPTILVSGDQRPPFNLQSFNQIFYESLVDLRDKLEKRIRVTLDVK
jgi:hypothetical protein